MGGQICAMDNIDNWNPFYLFPMNFWHRFYNSLTSGGKEAEEKAAVRLSLRQPQKPQLVRDLSWIQFWFHDHWYNEWLLNYWYNEWLLNCWYNKLLLNCWYNKFLFKVGV